MNYGPAAILKINKLLKYMNDNPGSKAIKEMSDYLKISKSSASDYTKALIKEGIIKEVVNPDKGRRGQTFKYALTAEGHRKSFTGNIFIQNYRYDYAESPMCDLVRQFINSTTNRSGNYI